MATATSPIQDLRAKSEVVCPIHNKEILIYEKEEEKLFTDDNRQEVAIFIDKNGKRYLKRFIAGSCDEHCKTIIQLLEEKL
uniref:Uncharacterized protein n=1 Tax=viral metagenome TaxID=1070528 RepID=A0A6M3JBK1_9ZZZZ